MQLKTTVLLTLMLVSISPLSKASPPPQIPPNELMPPITPPPNPTLITPPKGVTGPSLYTLSTIRNCTLSGVVCEGIRLALLRAQGFSGLAAPESEAPHLAIAPDSATTLPPANASADGLQDAEPAVTSITAAAQDTTVSTDFKYLNGSSPWLYYSSTTTEPPFTNSTSFSRNNPMPASGYTYSGDPLMAINPYNSNKGPLRMYCVGITYNNVLTPWTAPNAIALWHADEPGYSFTSPTIVDSFPASLSYELFLDKPAIAVSWHQGTNPNDLGYVYVAYVSADFTNKNTAILVSTSTDGGASFPNKPVIIAYGGDPNPPQGQPIKTVANPQIIVENNGAVDVLWVDFNSNTIQMATSTNYGGSFGAHVVAASGNMATVRTVVSNLDRAETAPMAVYNSAIGANSIDMVWHDITASGLTVEYAFKDNNGWHRPSQAITQPTGGDQFFPAIDFNTSSNVAVTYYGRTSANTVYRPYQAYLDYIGIRLDGSDHDMAGFDSDPRTANRFIGDYQTVWDWTYLNGEKATGSWIGIVNTIFDNYLTTISY